MRISGPAARSSSYPFAIVSGSANDNRKVQRVESSLNGGPYRRCNGSVSNWYQLFDVRPGRNVIRVRAIDPSENVSRVRSVAVIGP